jgi:hypothetical protein
MRNAEVKQMVCSLILATDMSYHHSMLKDFKEINTNSLTKIYPKEEKEVFNLFEDF